jgi:hypothetical protein
MQAIVQTFDTKGYNPLAPIETRQKALIPENVKSGSALKHYRS